MLAILDPKIHQANSIQVHACGSNKPDESKSGALTSGRAALSNLSVNIRPKDARLPSRKNYADSADPILGSSSGVGASQNNSKPNSSGLKLRISFEGTPKNNLPFPTKRKQKVGDNDKKISGEFDEAKIATPTTPEDISGLTSTLRSNKTKWRHLNTPLFLLPGMGDINTQFDHPDTILQAIKPFNGSLSRLFGLEKSPGSVVTISDHDKHENQKYTTDKEAFHELDKVFFLQLMRLIEDGDNDTLSTPKDKTISSIQGPNGMNLLGSSLLKVIPLGIISHLLEDNKLCLSLTSKGQRCKIRHSTKYNLAQLQSMISFNTGSFLENVQQLVQTAFCYQHRKIALREIQNWEGELQEFSRMHDLKSILLPRDKRLRTLVHWICLLNQSAHVETTKSSLHVPAEYTNIGSQITVNPIQNLKPYKFKHLKGSVSEELAKLLTKPLQKADIQHRGSIYIFWQRPNFGYLKIGRTNNVRRRLREWNEQCKKDMGIHYPDLSKGTSRTSLELQQLSHIARIEHLIHVELMDYRRCEPKCPGCHKKHIEWFEVSTDLAIRVVRKWTVWMMTLPYVKHMIDGKEEWKLKDEEMARIDQLCQLEQTSLPSNPVSMKEKRATCRSRHSLPSKEPNRRYYSA